MRQNTQLVIDSLTFSAYYVTHSFIHGFNDIVNSFGGERFKGIYNSVGKFVVGLVNFIFSDGLSVQFFSNKMKQVFNWIYIQTSRRYRQ